MTEDRVELTPDNFCYLSNCQFFIPDIQSTGCKIDYMCEKKKKDVENLCPLAMERAIRSDDSNWELDNQKMMQKLRDLTMSLVRNKKIIDQMGSEAYGDAVMRCNELSQKAYDAKIEYERLQYQLQETKNQYFGEFEKEKK